MIKLSGVKKIYRMGEVDVCALRGVSLTIESGEFIAIMGPSGSGKSTLMHILGLLDAPDEGSYSLLGREISRLKEKELASLRAQTIGFIFQQFNLLARTTALDNVRLPLLYGPNGKNPELASELLGKVGLEKRKFHKPNELSGGQQQRVAIARSLIKEPSIIMADEPTGNLDSQSASEIMAILQSLNESGITVILVTHEEDIARHAQRVIRMKDGLIESDQIRSKTRLKPVALQSPSISGGRLGPREIVQHFRQAWRALSANKARTTLSMLGILIGVAAVIAMLALGKGAQQSIEARLASMGSNLLSLRPGSRRSGAVAMEAGAVTRFTLEDARALSEEVPQVNRASPLVSGRAQMVYENKNWNTQILGATPQYAPMRAMVPQIGRFFTDEENQKRARVVVLGMTPARELFGEGINPIGEFIKINRINFQVIGILPEKGATGWRDQDDTAAIPITTAMRRLLGKNFVDSIDIEAAGPESLEAVEENVKSLIIARHRLGASQENSFEIRNMAEIQEALTETSRTMSLLLASIAAISLLVGGIGIMNIMLVSVTERTREIGLRKAVGAQRKDILAQFLIEAMVVSIAGGLTGIVLGWAITLAMSYLAGWQAQVSPGAVILAFIFSAGVGIIFGLWPARKASRLNPIEALRYE